MNKRLTVLLTNDDGIGAPGLAALERSFSAEQEIDLWIVAPDGERSTSSHAMHLARPVLAREDGPRRFAVEGYPADCVFLALFGLMPSRPDLVVSGINRGANLGSDVIYSGTVAGAREAALRGVHGVSASLVEGDDFAPAAKSVVQFALQLSRLPKKPALLINLNYPAGRFEGPCPARLGVRKYPETVARSAAPDAAGGSYLLGGPPVLDEPLPGTDSWLVGRGIASATPLLLDQTDQAQIAGAAAVLPFLARGSDS